MLSYSLLCYGGCEGVKEVPYLASKAARSLDSTSLSGGLITVVVTPQNPGDLAAAMQKSRYNQAVTIYEKMLEFAAKTSQLANAAFKSGEISWLALIGSYFKFLTSLP